jgi:hypothetical protein
MPRVTYVGPFDLVYVPRLGVEVRQGESVETGDAATAESLLAQRDNWQPAKSKTPISASDKEG